MERICGTYYIYNPQLEGVCYVGATRNFKNRNNEHRYSANHVLKPLKLYKFIDENGGIDKFKIELYETCNPDELVAKERELYDILKPSLNTRKPSLPIEFNNRNARYTIDPEIRERRLSSHARTYQRYHENIMEKHRIYREANRETLNTRARERRANDVEYAEKIRAKDRERNKHRIRNYKQSSIP